MAPKVFILGITGYIGGSAAASIIRRNPDWEVTASVRTEEQCNKVKAAFPNVRTVVGDLNSEDILSAESAKADIVINCANADHPAAVKSILKGLNERTASSSAYYIHTSGTGILIDLTTADGEWGNKQEERVLSDVADIKDILGLPTSNLHVVVDNTVRGATNDKVKTAVVAPPLIYGKGTGPIKTRSVQAPGLVAYALKRNPAKAFVVGEGKSIWNNVHVADLGEAFALLAETAANGGGSVKWGPEAFFFCENGDNEWIDLSKEIARVGQEKGYFQTTDVDSLTKADLATEFPDYHYGPLLWGSNSRGKADRLRELGWKPTHPALLDTIPELFESEAKALGK